MRTGRQRERGKLEKPQKHGESKGLCPAGESSQIKKLTQGETKTKKKLDGGGEKSERFPRRARGKQVSRHPLG